MSTRYARAALPACPPVTPAFRLPWWRATLPLLVAAALALCGASPAAAQLNNPVTPLVQGQSTTRATSASSTATASGGGSTGLVALVIGLAVLLLAAIAWFIVHDARASAPVATRAPGASAGRSPDRQRRQRERAKAARRQRKRNR